VGDISGGLRLTFGGRQKTYTYAGEHLAAVNGAGGITTSYAYNRPTL
jgi:hypothetical protein